nr:hypothetical protein [Tanacetum cinerariifolium]
MEDTIGHTRFENASKLSNDSLLARGVFIQEPSESITTTTTTKIISSKQSHDKGKAIMIEEPVKPKKKYQIRLNEEATLKLQDELQAEFDEEQRLAREKAKKELEANINMEGKKLKDLKNKSFDSIRKMFDKAFNRVNIFVDFRTELDEGIEPSELGFKNEIEIASGKLVEIDKVIKGYKLEIKGHVFVMIKSHLNAIGITTAHIDVNNALRMVRIPLLDDKVLRVLGERLEEKERLLMSAKAIDKKQEEIEVVRDFLEAFPDDLSGLPPI